MANNSVLISNLNNSISSEPTYLSVERCLGEFSEEQKAIVRDNLQVPLKSDTVSMTDVEIEVEEAINNAFAKYLGSDNPLLTQDDVLEIINNALKNYVNKTTDQNSFLKPAKTYTDNKIQQHTLERDPHQVIPIIQRELEQYAKKEQVYTTKQVYTKTEVDNENNKYIKKDGTTPFIKAQTGVDPQVDSHLATKRYVDKALKKHLVEVDPHSFISILNKRLVSYAKTNNVYDKTETYSRDQVDSLIRRLVEDAMQDTLLEYSNSMRKAVDGIAKNQLNYVAKDGSTPFEAPQSGVDAENPTDFVTLKQLENSTSNIQCVWKTSGPVETTVGFIEDNSEVPTEMTLQEVMDAIFYGKSIHLTVPEYVSSGKKADLTVCIHGSLASITEAILYQDGQPIRVFDIEDFESGCVTLESLPITEDSILVFRVTYINGAILEEEATIRCSLPIFVGLLPKWKFGNTITMEYLEELTQEDSENNSFIGGFPTSIIQKFNFKDPSLRHPFVVVPVDNPSLKEMVTKSQNFGVDAFNIIDLIPLQVASKNVPYKMYIYKQALSSLNQEITFNFE